MSLFVSSQESVHDPKTYQASFSGSTNQIIHIADVLAAITTILALALMIIRPEGITLYAEYNHVCNVQLNIDPSLFTSFSFLVRDNHDNAVQDDDTDRPSEMRLGVDISLISDAFHSVASSMRKPNANNYDKSALDNVTCYLTYRGDGHPLVIEFEDKYMNEKLEFLTFYLDITYPYDEDEEDLLIINYNEVQFELMLKSDVFANLLGDLQQINTVDMFIYLCNEVKTLGSRRATAKSNIKFMDNQLNFISNGPIGHLKLIYPAEKTILEKMLIFGKEGGEMKPINTSLVSCYNFTNFNKILKAVKLSSKCKILKDLNGVLSIKLLCKNPYLSNYAGTLITFNMLEVASIVDDNAATSDSINNIFDDTSYEYAKDYQEISTAATKINEYEPLGHEPVIRNKIPLSLASFQTGQHNNLQISDSLYEQGRKRKHNNGDNDNDDEDDNNNGINTVGGAVEVPLFL